MKKYEVIVTIGGKDFYATMNDAKTAWRTFQIAMNKNLEVILRDNGDMRIINLPDLDFLGVWHGEELVRNHKFPGKLRYSKLSETYKKATGKLIYNCSPTVWNFVMRGYEK